MSTPEGRLIVDRGTSTYAEGPERAAVRGTGAHNTIRVGGRDQFELWKTFRVGRRATVHEVETGSEEGYGYVTGEHDGYRSLGIRHRRTIFNLQIGGWLIVDGLSGAGWHSVESFVRCAPGIQPEVSDQAVALLPTEWSVVRIALPDLAVLSDLYSPRLGVHLPNSTVAARAYAPLPLEWIYWVAPHPPSAICWATGPDGRLRLSTDSGQQNI